MNGPPKPPANFSGLRYPSELIASSTLRPLARFSISLPAVDIGLLVTGDGFLSIGLALSRWLTPPTPET
jgi:hypothetical protein